MLQLSCRTSQTATSYDRNLVTSKGPGTVLSMQNVLLGQTKVMQIRQRETLNHQGAIIHGCGSLWLYSNRNVASRMDIFFVYSIRFQVVIPWSPQAVLKTGPHVLSFYVCLLQGVCIAG